MINWIHVGPSVTAAFLGSLVEFVEALTIVLAVGTVRGWRSALLGTAGGLMVLTALVVVLGPALGVIPITLLQLVIGLLLLLFGMNWLRKAVLRAAGIIPLHDEGEIFRSATATLRPHERQAIRWDTIAIVTTFKAVVLEGLVFIVLAVGTAAHMMVPVSLGAAAAGLVVAVAGVALRRPLARVPENTLKLAVGVLRISRSSGWPPASWSSHCSLFGSCSERARNGPARPLGECMRQREAGHDNARVKGPWRRPEAPYIFFSTSIRSAVAGCVAKKPPPLAPSFSVSHWSVLTMTSLE